MLVDRRTGEVLWFNSVMRQVRPDHKEGMPSLCKEACRYLLKPSR